MVAPSVEIAPGHGALGEGLALSGVESTNLTGSAGSETPRPRMNATTMRMSESTASDATTGSLKRCIHALRFDAGAGTAKVREAVNSLLPRRPSAYSFALE